MEGKSSLQTQALFFHVNMVFKHVCIYKYLGHNHKAPSASQHIISATCSAFTFVKQLQKISSLDKFPISKCNQMTLLGKELCLGVSVH